MFKKYGLTNVHLELTAFRTRGCAGRRMRESSSAEHPLTIASAAWRRTRRARCAPGGVLDAKKPEEFEKFKGAEGAIVIYQEPRPLPAEADRSEREIYHPLRAAASCWPAGLPDPYEKYLRAAKERTAF